MDQQLMGGIATFSGTTYQQRVIAYVAVHVLSQRRLLWFETEDDTPESVSGETGGPGDDCAVVLRGSSRVVEIQAKHGLTAGAELRGAVSAIFEKLRKSDASLRVVIAVDRTCSDKVLAVAADLDRLRSGRTDRIKAETNALLGLAGDARDLLSRISIIQVDVERDDSAHAGVAVARLEAALEDPDRAVAAWRLLVDDAGTLCSRGWARLSRDFVGRLESSGIRVKPAAAEQHRSLDLCRDLLNAFYVGAAKERLAAVEAGLSVSARRDPELQYRLLVLKASCEMRTGALDGATALGRRALDLKPNGIEGLRVTGFSRLRAGDFEEACRLANRAVAAAPLDPKAWAFKVQVDAEAGNALAVPPEVVARSHEYRGAQAHIARNCGEWGTVLEISSELLQTGERDPDILLVRAEALTGQGQSSAATARREALDLCAEILGQLRNDDDPRVQRTLSLRSNILAESGDQAGADADLARLRDIAGSDPNVLQTAAAVKVRAGDLDGAIRILEHPAVASQPKLLGFRSQLKKDQGDDEGARRDANLALSTLDPGSSVDTKLAVAEALLLLGDIDACRSLLSDPQVADAKQAVRYVLVGRIAIVDGRVDDAIRAFRAAAELEANARRGILFELADRLRRSGRSADAVEILSEFEQDALPDHEFLLVAHCLFDANRLADTQRLIDKRATAGRLAPSALSLAFDIALRSEDRDAAIGHLRALIGQNAATVEARVELTRLLFESGRLEEARAECRSVLDSDSLSPLVRMQAAYLLARLNGSAAALDAAFRSYREARHDYRVHEGLIVVSRWTKEPPLRPDVVAPDTYVRLRRGSEVREYTIFSSGPIDPTRGERTLDEARSLGLFGARVGDGVSISGAGEPADWTVEEILTAVHHGVQEALMGYERNFPGRTFLRSFPAPDGTSVDELSPLIQTVAARKKREDDVFRVYFESCLPLGFVAWALGLSIPAVMARIATREDGPGLFTEFGPPAEQRGAVEAARRSSEIVLSRSALSTIESLGLRDLVMENYSLIIPRSLLLTLQEEARDAAETAAEGRTVVGAGETGLVAQTWEPGHLDLVSHRDELNGLVNWINAKIQVEARPLELVEAAVAGDDLTLRDKIGPASWDALELARYKAIPLYADDLGLRRLDDRGKLVQSFSTSTLLVRLAEDGKIDTDRCHRCLHDLILARHLCVTPSAALLVAAVMRAGDIGYGAVSKVFGVLARLPTIGEAAGLAAKTFKELARSAVETMPLGYVVRVALEAMRPGWPTALIAQEVREASSREFLLMPRQFREIDRACSEFARS
jgi:tetratricopeptide (TPR) repeat protein